MIKFSMCASRRLFQLPLHIHLFPPTNNFLLFSFWSDMQQIDIHL